MRGLEVHLVAIHFRHTALEHKLQKSVTPVDRPRVRLDLKALIGALFGPLVLALKPGVGQIAPYDRAGDLRLLARIGEIAPRGHRLQERHTPTLLNLGLTPDHLGLVSNLVLHFATCSS